jgi:aldehyde dehydrogenase (NAD+)
MGGRLGAIAARLGIEDWSRGAHGNVWLTGAGARIASENPTDGTTLAVVCGPNRSEYDRIVDEAHAAFLRWRMVPAPKRGELVRRLGELLREHKEALAELISLEVGKIRSEALGEVQEMIDICDFALGLSRQLHGLTIASERPCHRMMEQWHPLGPIGVVTAFNFPVAVWAWNAAIAAVCGDTVVWKPSPHAPLCSVAVQTICERAMKECDALGVFTLAVGGSEVAQWIADDRRLPLVSFTGSCAAGREVAVRVAGRLGRSLLELGGNNAVVVMDDADLALAVRAIVFGAVGTAGQRCTTTRRLFVQKRVIASLLEKLLAAYRSVPIGDPMEDGVLVGPLISEQAVKRYEEAIAASRAQGGRLLCGGRRLDRPGYFVEPTIIQAPPQNVFPIAWEETFTPILYVFEFETLAEAIAANNAVPQGLSSAIFTDSVRAAETFLSPAGSDCGIANVNVGTSGAEIGGAFGGEKDTGGGREAGSDAWKSYMRRQTCTINYGTDLPLAQGVRFV